MSALAPIHAPAPAVTVPTLGSAGEIRHRVIRGLWDLRDRNDGTFKGTVTALDLVAILHVSLREARDLRTGRKTFTLEQLDTIADAFDVPLEAIIRTDESDLHRLVKALTFDSLVDLNLLLSEEIRRRHREHMGVLL